MIKSRGGIRCQRGPRTELAMTVRTFHRTIHCPSHQANQRLCRSAGAATHDVCSSFGLDGRKVARDLARMSVLRECARQNLGSHTRLQPFRFPLCTQACGEATWGNHLTGIWSRKLTDSLDDGVSSLEGQTPHDRTAIAHLCHGQLLTARATYMLNGSSYIWHASFLNDLTSIQSPARHFTPSVVSSHQGCRKRSVSSLR
jgi:hypothetical protein